jgi:hypothetical protein
MRTVIWYKVPHTSSSTTDTSLTRAEDTSEWKVSTIGVPAVEANYETILKKATNGSYAQYGPIASSLSLSLQNE